jgi:hypothetical protein
MIAAASWTPRAPPALRTTVFTAVADPVRAAGTVETTWFGKATIAAAAGLEQSGPVGGLYDDELFTADAGHARVYLPVRDSPSLDGTGARWELPAGRFAVALAYAALGT